MNELVKTPVSQIESFSVGNETEMNDRWKSRMSWAEKEVEKLGEWANLSFAKALVQKSFV